MSTAIMLALYPRLTAALFISGFVAVALGTSGAGVAPAGSRPEPVGSEVIVHLSPKLDGQPSSELSALLGGRVLDRIGSLDAVRLGLREGETPAAAVARIEALDGVTLAEPNPGVEAAYAPNDPLYHRHGDNLHEVGVQAAWDLQRGDPAVTVAVLDSGVDLSHPDLAGAVWSNRLEVAGNAIDDDANGCVDDVNGCAFVTADPAETGCPAPTGVGDVADDNGHGTFVAGIIGARGDNSIGMSGVAPGVTLLPVKILDCEGRGTAFDAAKGLLYAAAAGARIANVSFSMDGYSSTLHAAVGEARNVYGMVLVAATGNAGRQSVSFPANLPEVIAVSSSGMPGEAEVRSNFSNWGAQVAVAAPGLLIASTVPVAACGVHWLCLDGDAYAVASGTSFAAPLVSGLAALILSQTPALTPEAVRVVIVSTAEPLPDGDAPGWDGYGRVDFAEALHMLHYFDGAPVSTN